MKDIIAPLLAEEHIESFGILPLSVCSYYNLPLLQRTLPEAKTVIPMLFPYYTGVAPDRNLSLYAVARDYHLYAKELYARLCPRLEKAFPGNRFVGFSDHSPIDERDAALKCGLGVKGDNGLLISPRYGSYLFLGEILTDMESDEPFSAHSPEECLHCGACRKACPKKDECLSALTQKKGELSEEEEEQIMNAGSVWGCDLCQTCCPMNRDIELSPIPFFWDERLFRLDSALLDAMDKEEFQSRAFAWRGRKTIERNLKLFGI